MSLVSSFSHQFHNLRYIYYLQIIYCLTSSGKCELSRSVNQCANQNDIRFLYSRSTRTCSIATHEETQSGIKFDEKSLVIKKEGPVGVEIRGINFTDPLSEKLIEWIRENVHEYEIMIFKDQGLVSGDRHVEISHHFGQLKCFFFKHPRSPHPDVFRLSNDENEGCTNVGRTGWHIDGSFLPEPYSFSLYHIVSVGEMGNTEFISLKDLIGSISSKTRERWERLWMACYRFGTVYHPLLYPHPITKHPTLCFHLGTIDSFVWDYGTNQQRETNTSETNQIKEEIHREITKDDQRLVYSHKWEVGDFIISDNLAVGHQATPETQLPVSQIGLRVLHRTTVQGVHQPHK